MSHVIDVAELEKELETINTSLKGKIKVSALGEFVKFPGANSKPDLFQLVKELYSFSKKAVTLLKSVNDGTASASCVSVPDVSAAVRRELKDILPDLLKEALGELKSAPDLKPEADMTSEEPKERHTLTLKIRADTGAEESEKIISEQSWTDVVKRDVTTKLSNVPLEKRPFLTKGGTVKFSFNNKENMVSAQKALAEGYEVTPDSQEVKMIDPKLTMFDLKGDFATPEELCQKILDKNCSIKGLVDAGDIFKVVFLEKDEKDWACLQVSLRIRQCIRRSGDYINAGLGKYRVRDRYHVVQCFDCQGFGHMSGSEYCKCKKHDAEPTCFYCAGTHKSKMCNQKKRKDNSAIKCVNCSHSRNRREQDKCKTHTAADRLCPFYVREQNQVMGRTNGCNKETRNYFLQRSLVMQKENGIM